ncbi:MAG: hypothetical protein H6712_03520 [Myxococcales bacterium]|nr:hypothetical protein [Myxococcales bacterium]
MDQMREPELPAWPRWSGARHLAALRRHSTTGPGVPEVDVEGYASEVLALTAIPARAWPRWLTWALDSALGGSLTRAIDDGRWLRLGCGTRIRLGDCPWSLRYEAACASLRAEGDGGDAPCPMRVAERVLEQVLEHVDSPEPVRLASLSPASIVQLADAVLRRDDASLPDDPEELAEPLDDELEAERVRMVLGLHRILARTSRSRSHEQAPRGGDRRPVPTRMPPHAATGGLRPVQPLHQRDAASATASAPAGKRIVGDASSAAR